VLILTRAMPVLYHRYGTNVASWGAAPRCFVKAQGRRAEGAVVCAIRSLFCSEPCRDRALPPANLLRTRR
jgi:hypothetical protein